MNGMVDPETIYYLEKLLISYIAVYCDMGFFTSYRIERIDFIYFRAGVIVVN
ncbi:hypothetical protein FBY04_102348 [Pseudomonas sp. SJZ080]|nr:hypothetical protein FBY04_102348 [Pseudomonas sp. SJZ080]